MTTQFKTALATRLTDEKTALILANAIADLAQKNVHLTVFAQTLTPNPQRLLALHMNAKMDMSKTTAFVTALDDNGITDARVDVGIAVRDGKSVSDITGDSNTAPQDVALYGFGRIGRILARLLMSRPTTEAGLQLKAIVVRPAGNGDLAKRASLLERDSVHGWFDGSVLIDEKNNGLLVNGRFIQLIYATDPSEVDYTAYGLNNVLVIDNTGKWKDEAGLGTHLTSQGASKVLLTAPAKGAIKNVVYGVNDETIGDDTIVSAASCTTNAITPILKVLNDKYGIESGHMETIHAFTNDQNLVDNHHKADRRGRAAPLNMVMTSTGAAKAVGKALPELEGKLTGNAIRVPTPNVSLAILNLILKSQAGSQDELNAFIEDRSKSAKWQEQIAYSDSNEAVSTDFVGCEQVAIFDAKATITDGNRATLYIWYDNEMGYSTQVIRVAETMANIRYKTIV